MSFDAINAFQVGPLGAGPRRPHAAVPAALGDGHALHQAATIGTVPDSPPPEVMRQVDDAARRHQWLRENGRELRFEWVKGEQRVRIEVRDLDGRLLREIPPSAALDATAELYE